VDQNLTPKNSHADFVALKSSRNKSQAKEINRKKERKQKGIPVMVKRID